MSEHEREGFYTDLERLLAPVLESSKQQLGLMVELKVNAADIAAVKDRLERIETVLEEGAKERAEMMRQLTEVRLELAKTLAVKADKAQLDGVVKDAHNHELSTAKLIGGVIAVSGIVSFLVALFTKHQPKP